MKSHHNAAMLAVLIVGAGCASTKPDVEHSGFLADYTILAPGEDKYHAKLRWIDPETDFAAYDKILLDPVAFWRGDETRASEVSVDDLQRLTDNFYQLMYEGLSQDYEMVRAPTAGALRIETAVTSLGETNTASDVISTAIPVGVALSAMSEYATAKPEFVGEAAVEFRCTDSVTGRLLIAGVDRRVGGKSLGKELDRWSDVDTIMQLWTDLCRYRLCRLRGVEHCPVPQDL